MRSRWVPLAFFLLLTSFAGLLGALATATSVHSWYPALQKPSWTPPNWLFAPVWTVLYISMAVAAWRIWRVASPVDSQRTVRLFAAQLMLNSLWSILFFGLRRPELALLDVLALWLMLMWILVRFWSVDRIAGMLWGAYVAWVTYAALLNASVWELNR